MNSQEYWNSRAMKRLTSAERKANQHIDKINKIYLKANLNIQQQIANIYKNYSKETGIDVDTLKELLSKKETDAFWKTMEGKGLKQYVKSNYKSRITRLEQIQAQLYAQAKGVYDEELRESTELYKDIINDSYYKTVYDTAIGTGYDFSFNKIDERTFETILNEKWLGSNYSQRIWKNTDIVADKISEVIGGSLISGQPMQYAINELINIFGVGRYYAERLVRTETNHFNSEAEALAYEELNVKKYVFVATLDSKTSEICQEHDHNIYELDKRQPGENYPPLHPNCRSTVRAYLGKEEESLLKRRAVNPITGKVELIDNISYKDWIKKYVTNDENNDIISKNVHYKRLSEEEHYKLIDEHRKNISGDVRKSIYKMDWDTKQTLNKYGYINSEYATHINKYRREGSNSAYNNKDVKEFEKTIQNLKTAINSNVLNENIETERFLNIDWIRDKVTKETYKKAKNSNNFEDLISELTNKTVPENQFISTSINENNVYNDRQIKMIVKANKGVHAFVTENIMESEVVFDDSDLFIEDIKEDNKKLIITVKLLKRR